MMPMLIYLHFLQGMSANFEIRELAGTLKVFSSGVGINSHNTEWNRMKLNKMNMIRIFQSPLWIPLTLWDCKALSCVLILFKRGDLLLKGFNPRWEMPCDIISLDVHSMLFWKAWYMDTLLCCLWGIWCKRNHTFKFVGFHARSTPANRNMPFDKISLSGKILWICQINNCILSLSPCKWGFHFGPHTYTTRNVEFPFHPCFVLHMLFSHGNPGRDPLLHPSTPDTSCEKSSAQ